jgi:hypothetical protein
LEGLLTDVTKLRPHPRNARMGDTDAIVESIVTNGLYRPLYVQRSTGIIVAGNHTYAAALELGATELPVVWLDVDDRQAEKIMLADNRTADRGGYDMGLLLDLVTSLGDDLIGTGYSTADLDSIRHLNSMDGLGLSRDAELEQGKAMPARPRSVPLTMSFSSTSAMDAVTALRLGWRVGMISHNVRIMRKFFQLVPRAPRLAFMDHDWHHYDAVAHGRVVQEFRPIATTVRDLLTEQQADHEGVTYYSVEQTINMAKEVAPYVDDIILVPKYDCLDQLPRTLRGKRVVLGYSVETSYGGTQLPISQFAGWPIHLLGGSWEKQRAYLALMGDDVVSLDHNHALNVAEYGRVLRRDGTSTTLTEIRGAEIQRSRHAALALSLAEIANGVRQDFHVDLEEINVD